MTNTFSEVMSKRTTEELIKIISLDKSTYQPDAIKAAEDELKRRNVDTSKIQELGGVHTQEAERVIQIDISRAGMGARFVHFVVDTIAWLVLTTILAFLLVVVGPESPFLDDNMFALLFWFATYFGYYLFMETQYQKTLGKLLTGTRVIMKDGRNPTAGDILIRTIGRFIPFDNVSFLFTRNGIHDFISATAVVKEQG